MQAITLFTFPTLTVKLGSLNFIWTLLLGSTPSPFDPLLPSSVLPAEPFFVSARGTLFSLRLFCTKFKETNNFLGLWRSFSPFSLMLVFAEALTLPPRPPLLPGCFPFRLSFFFGGSSRMCSDSDSRLLLFRTLF